MAAVKAALRAKARRTALSPQLPRYVTDLDRTAAKKARAARIKAARTDGAAFNEYVLRDEQNGKRIKLAPYHAEWHDLIEGHDRLIIWSHVEAGKTSQLSIGRALFELGRDPGLRIVIVSNTAGQATKITRAIAKYIETSKELHEVFPHLRPGVPWSQNQITVVRSTISKDPSIQACGAHGNIVGARIDLLILDDILDLENTQAPQHRDSLQEWFLSSLVGRLTEHARVICVGNAYHPQDLLHWLAAEKGYEWRRYRVANDNGTPAWPANWSLARITKKREELGPVEAARQLDCIARDDSTARCQEAWVLKCLERGVGIPLLSAITAANNPAGAVAFTGVDIGVKRHKKAGKTVVFTILFHANGDRQVVDVVSGRMSAPELISAILSAHHRFGSIVMVEDNGAQDLIIQLAKDREPDVELFVRPFNTGGNKSHPVFGVESVFAEFAAGRWIIPADNDNAKVGASGPVIEWLSECLNYHPQAHTGDHLMASWFAREGYRMMFGAGHAKAAVEVRVLGGEAEDPLTDPERAEVLDGWEMALQKRPA